MKIYTKTGDKGSTSLLGGQRVEKNHPKLEAYGTIDELNSWVGLMRSQIFEYFSQGAAKELCKHLEAIQNDLFLLGSHMACATPETCEKFNLPPLDPTRLQALEDQIDKMDKDLEPLKNFILPFGAPPAASAHIARTVCRRAERLICLNPDFNVDWVAYINRLSDFLFVSARYINKIGRVKESTWTAQA